MSNQWTRKTPVDVKFWPKVAKGEGCWEWTASLRSSHSTLARLYGVTYQTIAKVRQGRAWAHVA